MRGCFVTGTDTGVGKTVVAGAIVASLHARGIKVCALKPLITGLDEAAREDWPRDHEILATAAGTSPEKVIVAGFGPPVSPHLALELAGTQLDPQELVSAIAEARRDAEVTIVEGVGGLLVPITPGYDVRCLAADVGLPLNLSARSALGTINHTLLTLEAARASNLDVVGVVLTPWPQAPSVMECSNRATIERLGNVPVATLPYIGSADPEMLASAGRLLPLDDWLA